MDQLKIVLDAVKKYQFWVLCGVMVLTSSACWWFASASLAGQFRQQTTQIESNFNSVKIAPGHPNEGTIKTIRQEDEALEKRVYEAWKTLYAAQKEKNTLSPKLGPDFIKRFENLKPGGDLGFAYRGFYQNFIKAYLPHFPNMIDARLLSEQSEGTAKVGGRAGTGQPSPAIGKAIGAKADAEPAGIVEWKPDDYNRIERRFTWPETPSTLDVVLAQEDLWVYETLLRAIDKVNKDVGATSSANAAVKRIDALKIGKDASAAWELAKEPLFQPTHAGAAMGHGPREMGAPPSRGGAAGTDERSMTGRSQRDLIESRYIDDKGQPLPYQPEYPYVKHPFPEFTMMPIYMSLLMDQRRLPDLLVQCANSNMPVEVRRVRIGELSDHGLSSSGGTDRRGGMGGVNDSPPAPAYGSGAGDRATNTSTHEAAGQYDIAVQIYAVIYIYNPPKQKLGAGAASVTEPAAGPLGPAKAAPASPFAAPPGPAMPGEFPAAPSKPAAFPGK